MKEFTLQEIRQKYDEYKSILDEIANGNYRNDYTIGQIEIMHKIVKELEDQGFHLIVRKAN